MSNILQMQQNLIDIQERINREIQFGEDSQRELLATVVLMRETLQHMETQINRLFHERNASLVAALGHPVKGQTVNMTAEAETLPALETVKKKRQPEAETAEAAE